MHLLPKADIRALALKARQDIPAPARENAEALIFKEAYDLLQTHKAMRIAGYVPVKGEVDALTLLELLARNGHETALPAVGQKGTALRFLRYDAGDDLVAGFKNIPEPPDSAGEILPDALLVPLVAFRADGQRIGYGAGYYDRTLAAWKTKGPMPLTIGLAFECQKFDNFTAERHDWPLDYIMTEGGLYGARQTDKNQGIKK